jgi:hypothetical protein
LLVNQFNEELKFSLVDKAVANRGIRRNGTVVEADQFVVALDYEQHISQIAADDFPNSGLAGPPGLAIHHEPGLWLHMANEADNGTESRGWRPFHTVIRCWHLAAAARWTARQLSSTSMRSPWAFHKT